MTVGDGYCIYDIYTSTFTRAAMRITDVTISDKVADHLVEKHGVNPDEVESCFFSDRPKSFRRGKGGRYLLFAQTDAGRYLCIVFDLRSSTAEVVTAWDI